tara:strand:- start:129 stop:332 length:204 start_codon:yes stop_codon:yes gene_type:complete
MVKKILSGLFAYDENVCCTKPLSPKKKSSSLEKTNNSSIKEIMPSTNTKKELKSNLKKVESDPFFLH